MLGTVCSVVLLALELSCCLAYPACETLWLLKALRTQGDTISSRRTQHWTTYWIFYSVLTAVARALYFFPFVHEARVLITLLMAHPKVEAATLIQQFLVTNPLVQLKVSEARLSLQRKLDSALLRLK